MVFFRILTHFRESVEKFNAQLKVFLIQMGVKNNSHLYKKNFSSAMLFSIKEWSESTYSKACDISGELTFF